MCQYSILLDNLMLLNHLLYMSNGVLELIHQENIKVLAYLILNNNKTLIVS